MRFIMYGAGALGGVIGAYLAQAGREVVFVDKNAEHVDRINGEGLTLQGIGGTHNIRAAAESGVDIISIGALTHSPRALDISLELEPQGIKLP